MPSVSFLKVDFLVLTTEEDKNGINKNHSYNQVTFTEHIRTAKLIV